MTTKTTPLVDQAIAYIAKHPGARSPAIAEALGTSPGNISAMLMTPTSTGYLVACKVSAPGRPPMNEYRLSATVADSGQSWGEFKSANRHRPAALAASPERRHAQQRRQIRRGHKSAGTGDPRAEDRHAHPDHRGCEIPAAPSSSDGDGRADLASGALADPGAHRLRPRHRRPPAHRNPRPPADHLQRRRKGGKKTAPDATQAARAAEPDTPAQTHVETNEGRASAAGEALPPETAWPFPELSRHGKPQEETNEKPGAAATE